SLSGSLEPPDTMGAVGPGQYVQFNNGSFSVFSKAGGAPLTRVGDQSFWSSVVGLSNIPNSLTDTRVLYDPQSQRWFACEITFNELTNNRILIARSNTADPTQGWKGAVLTVTNGRSADFPTLSLDANGVYIGTNDFMNRNSGTLTNVSLYSIPKADL